MTGDIRDEWRLADVERKANDAQRVLYKVESIASDVARLEYSLREIGAEVSRLRDEFQGERDQRQFLQDRLEQIHPVL